MTIGSLFWERHRWQADVLDFDAATPIAVPIRYGRQSTKRDDGYTMVVSRTSPVGSARIVPFRRRAADFEELLQYARIVGEAEGFQRELFTPWGCVAILTALDHEVLPRWRRQLADAATPIVAAYGADDAPCDREAVMHASLWSPELAERVDIVFATVTKPLTTAPSTEEIVAAMGSPPEGNLAYQYFRGNVKAGIVTFQDREIEAALRARGFTP
jgi:hypothetical protein